MGKGLEPRQRRRLTYANVISTLALVLVLTSGTAYAASRLIKGSQIAKGTITAKNIKSRSLLGSDFKKGQLPSGARGPSGPAGPTGATGAAGAAGAAGTAVAYATVIINSAGNPAFNGTTVGFTTVTNPQSGVYCVGPTVAGLGPIATPIGDGGVISSFSPQQCPGDYELVATGGALTAGEGFTVALP